MKLTRLDVVHIKAYSIDNINGYGIILDIKGDLYRVSNMNMPFMGTINDWFNEDDIEKK